MAEKKHLQTFTILRKRLIYSVFRLTKHLQTFTKWLNACGIIGVPGCELHKKKFTLKISKHFENPPWDLQMRERERKEIADAKGR
jgi:hypothetical protein